MSDEQGPGISRREALGAMAGAGAGITALLPIVPIGKPKAPSPPPQTIMLIRHGEKPTAPGKKPYGVTRNGTKDINSLNVRGWTRAGALVQLFAPPAGAARRFDQPTALFAGNAGKGHSKRPSQTISPLAGRLGLPISLISDSKPSDPAAIAKAMSATPGIVLGAFEHKMVIAIAQQLGTVSPAPPTKWPGARFDVVFVLKRQPDGSWSFSQIPQLALPGDLNSAF